MSRCRSRTAHSVGAAVAPPTPGWQYNCHPNIQSFEKPAKDELLSFFRRDVAGFNPPESGDQPRFQLEFVLRFKDEASRLARIVSVVNG
jgi:hypothetical protein